MSMNVRTINMVANTTVPTLQAHLIVLVQKGKSLVVINGPVNVQAYFYIQKNLKVCF